jgi:hypothetical protein
MLGDEESFTQADGSTAKPKVHVESTSRMIDDSALPDSNARAWHKRTLSYYALVRDEQA